MPNEPDDKPADSPAKQPRPAPPGQAKEHPATLGGFEILESIGKGGMGPLTRQLTEAYWQAHERVSWNTAIDAVPPFLRPAT